MNIDQLGVWPGFEDRVAMVTGASRGIGKAIAEALAVQGAAVAGTATTAAGAERITSALREKSTANVGLGVELDISNAASVDACVSRVNQELGSVTILVNNAGVTKDNLLLRMTGDEWNQVIATDLTSVYLLSRAVIRGMMKARYGRIVNISSVVALSGNPGQTNYAAAKAGMIGFSKSLAHEVASRNITVNTVAPGFIATDMTAALSEQQVEALRAKIPSGRLGTVADIAAAVVFLASEAGGYITGETLNINGGLHMS